MCGIAGLQSASRNGIDVSRLDALQDALYHRGPDSNGRFVAGETAVLSTRLAIIDLVHGDQPLRSPSGLVLVANGEIYNAPELRAQFPDFEYRTSSDCEVVFPLFEAYGLDFARHLRGMYAIALFDPQSKRLVLARDPFGIKPLYFTQRDGRFGFASEIGAILDAGLAERREDETAKAELLQLKYVIGSKTIVPEIHRVNPGETVVVENGAIQQRRAGDGFATSRQTLRSRARGLFGSPRKLLKAFDEVMSESVRFHLRSDVPCCLFYSGGIDSTILMLLSRDVARSPPHALTIGYLGKERVDESWQALRLAEAAGVNCDRIEMTPDQFWEFAPRIVAAIDDPMADPAVLPLYFLGQEAQRRRFKVAICGEGADELFGGYSRYRRATLPRISLSARRRRGVFTGAETGMHLPGWIAAMDAVERRQESIRDTRLQVLQAVDVLERLPNCLLIKLDRALMAHGVEGRTPFLDPKIAEFAMRLPDGLKSNPFYTKRFLRDWLADRFPIAEPYAKKRGFDLPLGAWMAARSSELAELVGAHPAIRQSFRAEAVGEIFSRCRQNLQPAWSLLCYALWHSHYIQGVDPGGDIASTLTAAARDT
jgi:asparagine synthase (glutamine-hydrolysing)